MWRFINTGFRSGKFNMDYDEFLAMRLAGGEGTPVIRVYGWSPYAVSLGYHQDENEIDVRRCKNQNIDVVRRPTGGRAILHAEELTYSVVTFAAGRSALQVYEDISRALVSALRHLGVNAEFSKILLKSSIPEGTGVSCFARTSKYEMQFKGKKIIGSAQRRYASRVPEGDDVVLQHGSILLGPAHKDLANFILQSDHPTREILRHTLEHNTIEVGTILQRPVPFEEAAEALREGFGEAWGINLVEEVDEFPWRNQGVEDSAVSNHHRVIFLKEKL